RLAYNNHGLMLAMAGIHVYALKALPREQREELYNICRVFLDDYFDKTFDEQGWCNENTPGYQDFFRKFLAETKDFATDYIPDRAFKEKIIRLYSLVESALHKVVLPNGNIPPIGESGHYKTKFRSTSG